MSSSRLRRVLKCLVPKIVEHRIQRALRDAALRHAVARLRGMTDAQIASLDNLREFRQAFGNSGFSGDCRFLAECAKRAIGGRVYHEAYPSGDNQWVSYNLDARKKGITGYQFRAPGEWFAELYAAYYSGKLKDSHPYIDWLKQF